MTKSHVRYLEGRLIEEANTAGRALVINSQSSGAKLPESDREDMEVFLQKVRQLLPVLGCDLVTPILPDAGGGKSETLLCKIKGLEARGRRTPAGFVVFERSQAVLSEAPRAAINVPGIVALRKQLLAENSLVRDKDHLRFTRNVEFTSPSAAASVVRGGGASGLIGWKRPDGKTLKEVEGG